MATVHKVAQDGFGKGTNELYDRARPTYPAEQLAFIQSVLANPNGPVNILELGSGTGIFTRCLFAHETFGPAVGQLIAVEPSAGMREQWKATVKDERATCVEGTFDTTGVEDGWADMVIVAQAWHWCPDFDKALIEIARVLKPTGSVVLTWNLEDGDTAWVAQNRAIYEKYEQNTPQFRLGLWRRTFEEPSYKKNFQPHEENIVPFIIPVTLEGVIDRVYSKSYIAVLPEDEKAQVKRDVIAAVTRGDGRTWIDEGKGVWEYPYKNFVVVMRKL